jgi:branched-chain amino acid transport system permease protein
MESWIVQMLNGIALAMLLFIIAAGFTLIFGLMGILNLSQGALYLVGGYVGVSVCHFTGNFFLGAIAGMFAVGILGILMQYVLLQHTHEHLPQALLTIGVAMFFGDLVIWIWGGYGHLVPKPAIFEGSVQVGELSFPSYRFLVIIVGVIVAVFLWWFHEKSAYGAIVRAGEDDEDMIQGIGVNIHLVKTLVFGLGAMLAGLGGVIGGPFLGVYPGQDLEVLTLAMVVVVIGGKGSLLGAFLAALTVGLADNLGRILFPKLSLFLIFALMAIILSVKPEGIFGRQ